MSIISVGLIIIFTVLWVGGALSLLAAPFAALLGWHFPILMLTAWFAYRKFFGPIKLPWIHKWGLEQQQKSPYFKEQNVWFESKNTLVHDKPVIVASHPHGIMCFGVQMIQWSRPSCYSGSTTDDELSHHLLPSSPEDPLPSRPKWTPMESAKHLKRKYSPWFVSLASEMVFLLPGFADWVGIHNVQSVDANNMTKLMKAKENIGLLPGGFEEATLFQRGKYRIFIKNRAGFIKYALRFGYDIVPTFSFGEEQTFRAFSPLLQLRLSLNRWKLPAVAFSGWFGTCMPFPDARLNTVIGQPIRLPIIGDNVTPADVAKYHDIYIRSVLRLS